MKFFHFFLSLSVTLLGILLLSSFQDFYIGTDHIAYLSYAESAFHKPFTDLGVEPIFGLLNTIFSLLSNQPSQVVAYLISLSLFLKFLFYHSFLRISIRPHYLIVALILFFIYFAVLLHRQEYGYLRSSLASSIFLFSLLTTNRLVSISSSFAAFLVHYGIGFNFILINILYYLLPSSTSTFKSYYLYRQLVEFSKSTLARLARGFVRSSSVLRACLVFLSFIFVLLFIYLYRPHVIDVVFANSIAFYAGSDRYQSLGIFTYYRFYAFVLPCIPFILQWDVCNKSLLNSFSILPPFILIAFDKLLLCCLYVSALFLILSPLPLSAVLYRLSFGFLPLLLAFDLRIILSLTNHALISPVNYKIILSLLLCFLSLVLMTLAILKYI